MKYVCLFLMAATAQLMTATPAPERKGTIITFEHAEPGRAHLASSRTLVKSAPAPMSGCAVTIKITGGTPDDGVKLFAFSLDQDDISTADWDRSTKTAEFALTPGHYDMAFPFRKDGIKTWVFREDVEVSADMTIEVSADEATSTVTFRPVDPKGGLMEGATWDYYETFDVVDGPCKNGSAYIFVMHDNIEFCNHISELGVYDFGPADGKVSTIEDQKICMSPNKHFRLHGVFITHNIDGQYIVSLGSKGSETQTLSNDPSSFCKVTVPFVASPAGEIDPYRAHENFTTIYGNTTGVTGGCTLSAPGAKNDTYLLSVNPDNDAHASLAIIPKVDEVTIQEMWSETSYALISSPLLIEDGKFVHHAAGTRTGGFLDAFTCKADGEYTDLSVYDSNWSFEHPAEGYTAGGNCPTLQLEPLLAKGLTSGSVPFNYIGRFDDVHEYDAMTATIKITKDDAEQYSGDYAGYKTFWRSASAGVHTMTIENTNVKVDGIDGRNLSVFTFDPKADDPTAPTVAILRFKDKEGLITDRFAKADDGILMVAAADYTYNLTSRTSLTASAPASVKIEYAPNGSSDFAELKAEALGNVFEHGYGQTYTASLAGVTKASANSWYDVRISLTDAAGNTCSELISPAFKADAPAGIKDIRGEQQGIAFDGSKISATGMIEVYGIAGNRAAVSADGSLDTTSLAPGVYIVRAEGKVGKIVVR